MKFVLMLTVIASSIICAVPEKARSQSYDLSGTKWTAIFGCNADITFNGNGTARVTYWDSGNYKDAHWTLVGNALHIKYDNWYGGIDGVMTAIDHIDAVESYKSNTTQEVKTLQCKLNPDK